MNVRRVPLSCRIRTKTAILLVLLTICFYILITHRRNSEAIKSDSVEIPVIHLALVVCGAVDRIYKLFPLIKSAILLSESPIHFHFVVDDLARENMQKFYEELPNFVTKRVTFKYYETWFPEEDNEWWLTVYKRCASQRVFFETVLKDVEKVIYLDTDTLIVHQLEEIWKKFDEFEPQHVIGATPDCPFYGCAYYKKSKGEKAHVPVVWEEGLNSGVIFMRLDRMRAFKFQEKIIKAAVKYKKRLVFGEQDLINVVFSNNIDKLMHLDCSYNYFPMSYCSQKSHCNHKILKIAHGSMNQFETDQSLFQMISHFLGDVDIIEDTSQILKDLRDRIMNHVSSDNCQVIKDKIFSN